VLAAWLVHLYTSSGVVMAFIAAADIVDGRYPRAFLWMFAATLVDTTDGVFARAARVQDRLPWFSGALLDNIVDYITYVFVPALLVWRAPLVAHDWSIPVCAAMLLSSSFGFSRTDAKTVDHFFTGFPSYWNIVVFYLYVAPWGQSVNAAILIALSVLVFVPIGYVYPSRTIELRSLTVALSALWGAAMLVLIQQAPDVSRPVFWFSLAFPIYYFLLSFVLDIRRRARVRR
jgi:phosphatidylcholine synthase